MNHILLKFNHGVEIGAFMAYVGHYHRTKDPMVKKIAREEVEHMEVLESILDDHNEEHTLWFDIPFRLVGMTVYLACQICPRFTLNWVARTMEMFAIFNYNKLAKMYPKYEAVFKSMALAETLHEEYFRLGPVGYQNLQDLRGSLASGRRGL